MLELEAGHTHLYPGARGRILSGAPEDGPATMRFADGEAARGELTRDILRLGPHRTAAGTRIAAKAWRITFEGERFRIAAAERPDGVWTLPARPLHPEPCA